MKKYALLVLASLFMFSVALSAQENGKQDGKKMMIQKREIRVEHHQGLVTPQMRADKMAKELGLSDAEKAKLKELIEKQDANRIKMADEVYKMKQEFKAKFEAQKKTNEADLEKVIGKEKFQKLQTMRTEKMEKMKQRMHKMHNDSNEPSEHGQQGRMKM